MRQKLPTRPTPKEKLSRGKRIEIMRTYLEAGKGYADMVDALGMGEAEIIRLAMETGLGGTPCR